MAKITLPIASVQTGGNLRDWFIDLLTINNEIVRQRDNGNVIIKDDNASPVNKIKLTQQEILDILSEGGEVEEYMAGIRMPASFANTNVPASVPNPTNILDNPRTFVQWFGFGAEVWIEGQDEFAFFTNPLAGAAGPSQYMTGSQMEDIRQLDTVNITILTTEEVEALGWTKKVW